MRARSRPCRWKRRKSTSAARRCIGTTDPVHDHRPDWSSCWLTLHSRDWPDEQIARETGLVANVARVPTSRPVPRWWRGILRINSDVEVPLSEPLEAHAAWMAARLVAVREGLLRFSAADGNRGEIFLYQQTDEGAAVVTLPPALVDAVQGTGLALSVKLETELPDDAP